MDMFDYSYFNWDVSRSQEFLRYIYSGGYALDPHHFSHNSHADGKTFEDLMTYVFINRKSGLTDEQIALWDSIGSISRYRTTVGPYSGRNMCWRGKVVSDEDVNEFHMGRFSQKEYADTIEENLESFRRILGMVRDINPDVRILLTTIPRYIGVRDKELPMIEMWKDKFYSIIYDLEKEYEFDYIDFTGSEISEKKVWYYDAAHFNLYGAMRFTDILKGYLK